MQKLSRVAQKKVIKSSDTGKKYISMDIQIPNDIVLLLSEIDPRIRKIISCNTSKIPKILNFDFNYAFTDTINSSETVDKIIIKNTKRLFFHTLRHIAVHELEINGVLGFDFSGITQINAFALKLVNLEIEIEDLDQILKLITPKSLELEDVNLTNFNQYSTRTLYSRIKNSNLLQLLIARSNIRFEEFSMLANKIGNIAYVSDSMVFSFYLNGNAYKSATLLENNSLINQLPTEEIESLALCGDEIISKIKIFPNLKFLHLKKLSLNTKTIRLFTQKLVQLKIESINFYDEIGFYEMVEKIKVHLRYFEINNVLLPHDGIEWIKKKLRNCQVVINKCNRFFID